MSALEPYAGFNPPVNPPRDLAKPGRILRSALSLVDRFNPFVVPQPTELTFSDLERDGNVAGLLAFRQVIAEPTNIARRVAWRAAFGGVEPAGRMTGVILTPRAQKFEGRGYQPKAETPQPVPAHAPAAPRAPVTEKPRPLQGEKPQPLRLVGEKRG